MASYNNYLWKVVILGNCITFSSCQTVVLLGWRSRMHNVINNHATSDQRPATSDQDRRHRTKTRNLQCGLNLLLIGGFYLNFTVSLEPKNWHARRHRD